jgi:hypothetical protein
MYPDGRGRVMGAAPTPAPGQGAKIMSSNRFARTAFASLAAAALAVGISTAPAHAVVVDLDDVRVLTADSDFGLAPVVAGVPGFAEASWDVAGGNSTPTVTGTLFIDTPGVCSRIRVETYDINHLFIGGRNGTTRCAVVGGANQWAVTLAGPADPDNTHLHAIVQSLIGGVWTDQGFAISDMNTI